VGRETECSDDCGSSGDFWWAADDVRKPEKARTEHPKNDQPEKKQRRGYKCCVVVCGGFEEDLAATPRVWRMCGGVLRQQQQECGGGL
jgi:hypothetical protein